MRIISKVMELLYSGGVMHNVVSLLHWKSCKRYVSSQDSNMIHASIPTSKNSLINDKLHVMRRNLCIIEVIFLNCYLILW